MTEETPHPTDGSVRIGMREIYDVLIGMREDVQRIGQASEALQQDVADHESRIRSLERWKYSIPIGVLAGLAPGVIALLR